MIDTIDIKTAALRFITKFSDSLPLRLIQKLKSFRHQGPKKLPAEQIVILSPRVRRITAGNSSVFTGPGTNTYLVGHESVTVIDPGPPSRAHLKAIEKACAGRLKRILVTHTHCDHSPAARLLSKRTGAPVWGMKAPNTPFQDTSFEPVHELCDDERIVDENYTLRVVYTPGHASNHFCFILEQEQMLFAGDQIMNGSTVVIAPPDGNMRDYLESLKRLKQYPLELIAPAHGDLLEEPMAVVDWLINHRGEREQKVINALKSVGEGTLDKLLTRVYDEVDKRVYMFAKLSLEAHLIKLVEEGRVEVQGTIYRWKQ
jgi:glyoxylase-like metal-dependent hydrolase (beta-lactamase superfamily II)